MTKKTRYFMAGSAAVLAAGLCTGLVAYYAGGFQAVSASPVSNELRYVPADATVVAFADVRSIMDSELRVRLKAAIPMHEQGQEEFQDQTGIDIEHDIDYIVAAMSPGAQPGAPAASWPAAGSTTRSSRAWPVSTAARSKITKASALSRPPRTMAMPTLT